MEGVEEREATEGFSPLGLEANGMLSGALTPARPTGEAPEPAAAVPHGTLAAVMADTGLGWAWRPGLQMRWCLSQSLCWQKEPQ